MTPLQLRKKESALLLQELQGLVGEEKKLVVKVLGYLQEVEARKLHLARGYSSMFVFCTEFLGYSEAEAHIRIQASRLGRDIPDVTKQIESGQLTLSVAALERIIGP